MPRPIANIDRNLTTCRAAFKVEADPARRDLISSLIDDLLSERSESNPHCTLCGGRGKALPSGVECGLCDRRRCNLKDAAGVVVCDVIVEDVRATRCPKGHPLPGR